MSAKNYPALGRILVLTVPPSARVPSITEYCGTTEDYIMAEVDAGRFPTPFKLSDDLAWDRQEVDGWIEGVKLRARRAKRWAAAWARRRKRRRASARQWT